MLTCSCSREPKTKGKSLTPKLPKSLQGKLVRNFFNVATVKNGLPQIGDMSVIEELMGKSLANVVSVRGGLKKNGYVVWDQASSLKEWNCPSAKVFAVNTIPATILIDKNGVIVARDLKGEELEAKIKEILLVE